MAGSATKLLASLIVCLGFLSGSGLASAGISPVILDLKAQAEIRNVWLKERLETVLPMVMRRAGIDMWVLIAREYNDDPVLKTMLPATEFTARRRTVLIFYDNGRSVERVLVGRYKMEGLYTPSWDKGVEPDQWARIGELVRERNPKKIAVNMSERFGLAAGLSKSQYDGLVRALGPELSARIVSGEALGIGWLETRTRSEMARYPGIVAIAHGIIAEGFSRTAITPGKTTAADLEWWYLERIRALGLETWFGPSVAIQRAGDRDHEFIAAFDGSTAATVILPGDLLHVDFGITYLGLNTDTQQHAYVLKPGESDAPAGLKAALVEGNRLQDILTGNFVTGRSGDEILLKSLADAKAAGLNPAIYTHPIGYHGHGAGPTIGLWDQQGGAPERGGRYPLYPMTAYSIELNVTVEPPEWGGQSIRIMLEEDAFFDGKTVSYINGRQTRFHLIPGD